MENEKLGVLLLDVPERYVWQYCFLSDWRDDKGHTVTFEVRNTDFIETLVNLAYICSKEEAKKYQQFRWVALEELE